MTRPLILLAALVHPASLAAQETDAPVDLPALTLEQQTNLRCGVVFGIVDGYQSRNDERALAYPTIAPRGREFFVRTTAKIMEDERFTRPVIVSHVGRQMASLETDGEHDFEAIDEIMPACLSLLDASGL
ncbi:hypothetical protein [Qipengyuania aquimaris]|uniref:Uncharacterized protein n=1 Tax=Qipengyuania aquimaris TaxID=255984 RepID=A0A9Q3S242_9SPHN|nr:hypothetical protein [Qipengyuania aquimaris]MBY6218810.1 hypothetical protein [Qipengyuania aquimaris]